MRVNLSVAIVQMVKSPQNGHGNNSTSPIITNSNKTKIEEIETCTPPEESMPYAEKVRKRRGFFKQEKKLLVPKGAH